MEDYGKIADEVLDGLHLIGKDRFYFENTEEDEDRHDAIKEIIDKSITELELKQGVRFDPERRQAIRQGLLLRLMKQQGFTDEEIETIQKATDAAQEKLEEKIAEHQRHIKDDFKVIDGGKA